jgi:predicted transcriptional regulator
MKGKPLRREKVEIKAQILETCKEPHTITDLLAKVGWFGGYYAKYVKELTKKGLLKEWKSQGRYGKKYQTTEKGLLWLNTYKQLKQIEEF